MARKYKATTETEHGSRKCLRVVVQREKGKKPLVAQFGGIPLKRKHNAVLADHTPQLLMTNRSELLKRVWVKQMAARRRKTLVVCRKCHDSIHTGTATASFRKQGPESRMTQKWSRPVREEGNGEGP